MQHPALPPSSPEAAYPRSLAQESLLKSLVFAGAVVGQLIMGYAQAIYYVLPTTYYSSRRCLLPIVITTGMLLGTRAMPSAAAAPWRSPTS